MRGSGQEEKERTKKIDQGLEEKRELDNDEAEAEKWTKVLFSTLLLKQQHWHAKLPAKLAAFTSNRYLML